MHRTSISEANQGEGWGGAIEVGGTRLVAIERVNRALGECEKELKREGKEFPLRAPTYRTRFNCYNLSFRHGTRNYIGRGPLSSSSPELAFQPPKSSPRTTSASRPIFERASSILIPNCCSRFSFPGRYDLTAAQSSIGRGPT